MKIPLNMGQDSNASGASAQDKALERDILSAKRGDWTAKQNLARSFLPLISSIAKKRTDDRNKQTELVEAGKAAVVKASRKYRESDGPHMFRILAADYIDSAMDAVERGSFFSRLFGR